MSEDKKHKIVILDDDHYPEGRVSVWIMPVFRELGITNAVHYKTFASMKKDILFGKLDRNSLFILDSSLCDEPDGHLWEFGKTVPTLLDECGVNYKQIVPASGGKEGRNNNSVFFQMLEMRGKIENFGQRCLEFQGLTGDPEKVVKSIVDYHNELFPNEIYIETKKEMASQLIEGGQVLQR